MEFISIVLLSVLAAVVYGICHDQVTARVCVEYFTIGHVPIFNRTTSPTLLAFGWGVIATWWIRVILGVPLAIASRLGSRPKLFAAELVRPIAKLLVMMAAVSLVAGIVGDFVASAGGVHLVGPMKTRVPADRHIPFLADLWAHNAAYATGFVGGTVLCGVATRMRERKIS